jgi:HEPN domain-containing protein
MMAKESPTISGLKKLGLDHLRDAKILFNAGGYNGAIYLAGYAVELALKAHICQHLGWDTLDEAILKRHDLQFLLRFTGLESQRESFLYQWDLIAEWNPEMRYDEFRDFQAGEASQFIEATEYLLEIFL